MPIWFIIVIDEAGVESKRRKTHYQFLLEIATAWIDLREPDIRNLVRASGKCMKAAAHASEANVVTVNSNNDDTDEDVMVILPSATMTPSCHH